MRYDTQQDYEGRPRMDAEDAPIEATEAPPRAAEVPPESSDVEDMEPEDRAESVDTPLEPEPLEPEPLEPEPLEPEPVAPEPVAAAAAPATPVAEESGALWPSDVVHDLQQRWREVQWRFVDDPRAAAEEAQALVTEALDRFSAAVTSRKGELDGWHDTDGADGADTERMRMVVRRYRDLLDRLLGS